MKVKVLLIASLVLVLAASASLAGDSPDLASYIQSIRDSGMSEMARSQILSVAGISCGASILTYHADPASGRYWPGYRSAVCPKPDAEEPELTMWKTTKRSETQDMIPRLRPFADADGSGFVTTEEGTTFRFDMEFGYLADQVAREESATIEALAKASGLSVEEARAKLLHYLSLQQRIAAAGIATLPEVKIAGVEAPTP